jgi:cellulose synthase/poly-beta-1,6-N-acetylglucosamine synthase-like glycosyltransferase
MLMFLSILSTAIALVLLVPTLVFFLEVVAGCFFPPHETMFIGDRRSGRIVILIPAHNESVGLRPTLEDVKQQLRPEDRVVVIADNCNDDTATVAAASGAEVIVRSDSSKIGKGYALDWGVRFLAADPPDIVIVIDADCRVTAGSLDRLAHEAALTQRPVQALYLMTGSTGSSINHQVAEFAWRVKNWLRPSGLASLSLPCQLMGTGMAFPWKIIQSAELSSGFIVEDLKLGIDLALAGHAPLFCSSATVTSTFPTSAPGAEAQRHRWEQGHIGMILTKAPAMLYAAVRHRNRSIFVLALDLMVPPLSLLALLLFVALIASSALVFMGTHPYALMVSATSMLLVFLALVMAWRECGRSILPLRTFALLSAYIAEKTYLYGSVLLGKRVSQWVRAERNKSKLPDEANPVFRPANPCESRSDYPLPAKAISKI